MTSPSYRRHRPWTWRCAASALGAVLVVASCGGGDSALDAGNRDEGDDAVTPATTGSADANDTATTAPTDGAGSTAPDSASPTTSVPASTTTIASIADLPPCPVDALDAAAGPVEITFWHGMANELETALEDVVADYNASQDRVRVIPQNQTAYETAIDKYIASNVGSRPDIIQLPEYIVQSFAQSGTFVPMQACTEAAGYDLGAVIERIADTYVFEGIQWAMPFNVSNPVYYYNRKMFAEAGLDPDDPPVTLEDLRTVSQQLVDSGAAAHGVALDSSRDAAGGWFFEQWFGRAGELFADNGNGRVAPATQVLFDNELGVEVLTYLQEMTAAGLAVSVGDNSGGQDTFFKMIDEQTPAASTIATSAAIANVISVLGSGVVPNLTPEDVGIGPMPGPSDTPSVQPGGASVWIPAGKGDETTAAAWDFAEYLAEAQTQSNWAAATGYVPIREDAVELDPVASLYEDDPRFRVPYDQLLGTAEGEAAVVPALGPLREIREQTARAIAATYNGGDVEQLLADAADASNALIATYNAQN